MKKKLLFLILGAMWLALSVVANYFFWGMIVEERTEHEALLACMEEQRAIQQILDDHAHGSDRCVLDEINNDN